MFAVFFPKIVLSLLALTNMLSFIVEEVVVVAVDLGVEEEVEEEGLREEGATGAVEEEGLREEGATGTGVAKPEIK